MVELVVSMHKTLVLVPSTCMHIHKIYILIHTHTHTYTQKGRC